MNRWLSGLTIASGIVAILSLPAELLELSELVVGGEFFRSLGIFALFVFLLGAARYWYLRTQGGKLETPTKLDSEDSHVISENLSTLEQRPSDMVYIPDVMRSSNASVYLDLPPDELMEIGKDETSLVADKLREPYLGKWIKVEGKVDNISRYPMGKFAVTIEIGDLSQVRFLFDERWGEYLETMGKNFYIVAQGKIDDIRSYELRIEESELVSYGRLPSGEESK